MKKILSVALFTCLVLGVSSDIRGDNDDEKEEGAIIPYTGYLKSVGKQVESAIRLQTDIFNEKGGFKAKRKKLKIVWVDDQSKPEVAIREALRIIQQNKIKSIVGPFWGRAVEAVIPLAEQNRVPFLVVTANPDSVRPNAGWVFNLGPTSLGVVEAICKHMKDMKIQSVALIKEDTAWGAMGWNAFHNLAPKFDINIIEELTSQKGSQEFRQLLPRVKAKNPQAVLVWIRHTLLTPFVNQFREQKMLAPIYCDQFGALVNPTEIRDGVRVPVPPWMVAEHVPNDTIRTVSAEFVNSYSKKFGTKPSLLSGYAWDAARVMTDSVDGDCTENSERIRGFLAKTKDYPGVNGTITLTEENPVGLDWKDLYIAEIQKGKFTMLK